MLQAIVSFIIATLSGLGVGSGGLLVIYLTLIERTPQLAAQGINLMFFLFSSAASLLIHMKKRRLFGGVILIMSAAGLVGSFLGSSLAAVLSAALLRRLFGGMLIVSGSLILAKHRHREKKAKNRQKNPKNFI